MSHSIAGLVASVLGLSIYGYSFYYMTANC